jgi:mannose-6-phosphate isomerase
MAGFRDTDKTATILRMLSLPWLDEIADELAGTSTPFQTLHRVVTSLLAWSGPDLRSRLQQLRAAAQEAEARSHRPVRRRRPAEVEPSSVERESVRVFAQTAGLVDRYPDDPGVLVTLLLNHVVLAAGDAMFIDAGVIHAYTSGFGVEVMAASDNVVRAGLTSKHVDIPELLEITNFTPMPPPRWASTPLREGAGMLLSPPVDEFELVIVDVDADDATADDARPLIVLCLAGEVNVAAKDVTCLLGGGQAVFVEESDGTATLSGSGRVAVARTPR